MLFLQFLRCNLGEFFLQLLNKELHPLPSWSSLSSNKKETWSSEKPSLLVSVVDSRNAPGYSQAGGTQFCLSE